MGRRKKSVELVPEIPKENERILSGFLSCSKFISVNRRLSRMKNGKMYLSDEYRKEEAQLWESLANSGLTQGCLDNSCFYAISMVFYLNDRIWKTDLDNLEKAPIDVLSRYLGFNDNRVVSYKVCKRKISNIPEDQPNLEWLYFEIEKVYKKTEDLTIPFEDFKEFVRKKTGHEIFFKLTNKLTGKAT